MRLCLLLLSAFLLSGCTLLPTRPKISASMPTPPSASAPFEVIAYWGSGVAGLAVLIGIILLWSKPKLGQQIIVTAISVLVGAQIMIWIGAHLVFISIITLVLGLAYVAYRHRKDILDIFDGETDKIIKGDTEV